MPAEDEPERAVAPSDYYLLDNELTDDERAIRDRVRAFGAHDVLPVINDYWERAEFPFELVPKLAALNVAGTTIEGYGCPGMSRLAAGIVARELSRADGSLNTFFGVHSGLAMGSIATLGSDEQKARWLPPMARLELIGAFALTEPRPWLGLGVAGDRARAATATTTSSTAPNGGSATRRSPTWSSCGRATRRVTSGRSWCEKGAAGFDAVLGDRGQDR